MLQVHFPLISILIFKTSKQGEGLITPFPILFIVIYTYIHSLYININIYIEFCSVTVLNLKLVPLD